LGIDFDGGSSQGFTNPKSQSWKNRVVNGSFPSLIIIIGANNKMQQSTIHPSNSITGYDVIGSTSMSSASDSSPSLETAFRRVIEGGPDKVDNVITISAQHQKQQQQHYHKSKYCKSFVAVNIV
jgi:hypothetical protein